MRARDQILKLREIQKAKSNRFPKNVQKFLLDKKAKYKESSLIFKNSVEIDVLEV